MKMEKYEPKSMLSILYDSAKKYAAIGFAAAAGCVGQNGALNQADMPNYQKSGKPDVGEVIDNVAEIIVDMHMSNYKQHYEAVQFIRSNADVNEDGKVTEKEMSEFLRKQTWIPYKGE